MAELSKYQQKIVKNYYDNLDTALLQRLGEQVTDLYLAEGKKREKLWTSITGSLTKLGVKAPRIETLRKSDDARQLANLLQELPHLVHEEGCQGERIEKGNPALRRIEPGLLAGLGSILVTASPEDAGTLLGVLIGVNLLSSGLTFAFTGWSLRQRVTAGP